MIDPALLSGIIKLTILLLIQYTSGSLVFYKGVKVNYTRKINHFALFFIPMFIDNIIPVQPSIELLDNRWWCCNRRFNNLHQTN